MAANTCIEELQDSVDGAEGQEKDDDPEVPKITKALPIIKWTEAFQDFLHQIIGVRMILLAYVICANVNVPSHHHNLQ